ncbi:hypothetical protein ACHAPT_005201 [Fusarium lateritium]
MDSPSLGNLPTDVLVLIFGQFCLHCQDEYDKPWDVPPLRYRPARQKPDEKSWYSLDRQALVSLSLVSRKFRDIAQSFLYHEFVLGYDDSWRTDLYTWNGRLISFMRTLGQRRDLANLVRVVYIHPRLLRAVNDHRPRDVLEEAAEALGIDLADVWKSRIPHPTNNDRPDKPIPLELFLVPLVYGADCVDEAPELASNGVVRYPGLPARRAARSWVAAELVAMLIAQLPGLEYLGFQRCARWPGDGIPASALAALNVSLLPVQRLDIGPQPDDVVRLCPGLEILNLQATAFWKQCPPLPNVRILRMTEHWADKHRLQEILNACTRGLETFAYESRPPSRMTSCTGAPRRNLHFQPSDAVRLLSSHQRTLKSLHLDLSEQGHDVEKIEDGLHLKDFGVLEHLFIGSEMIYGFGGMESEGFPHSEALIQLLPASIVSLSIQNKHAGEGGLALLEKGLVRLAELKQCQPDQFPKLRWVQCELGGETDWLSSMFAAVKVKFTCSSWSLSEAKPYLKGSKWTMDRLSRWRESGRERLSEDELPQSGRAT